MKTILLLLLLTQGAAAMDNQPQVEPIGLTTAFREFLPKLPKTEADKIPAEFRKDLLVFIEGIGASGSQEIGGWHLNRLTVPWTLTKWHKISDFRRVAAIFEVVPVKKAWMFENLKFITAKTEPKEN